ncbi:hypothetical protein D3C84_973820 [compost metagenome]
MHQLGDLRRAQLAQLLDQLLGVVQVLRLGVARGDRRGLVVQGLGGGNHQQHRIVSFGNVGDSRDLPHSSPAIPPIGRFNPGTPWSCLAW